MFEHMSVHKKFFSLRDSPPASSQPAKQQPATRVIKKILANLEKKVRKTITNCASILPNWSQNRGNRCQGVPQRGDKKRKWKKEGVPLTPSPYFERFWRKMGPKMEAKIDQKFIKMWSKIWFVFPYVFKTMLERFWIEHGAKIHPKIEPKMHKTSIKEVKAKISKVSFPSRREPYFWGSGGCQIQENSEKNRWQKLEVFQITLGIDF